MQNKIKFQIPESNVNIEFEQHKNKQWKITLESRDQERKRKELTRSVSTKEAELICARLIMGLNPSIGKTFEEVKKRMKRTIKSIKACRTRANGSQRSILPTN